MKIYYKEKYVSPFFKNHIDAKLKFGRNQWFYTLTLYEDRFEVVLLFKLLKYLPGLDKKEILLDYSFIEKMYLKNKTIYLEFWNGKELLTYGIYTPNANQVYSLFKLKSKK